MSGIGIAKTGLGLLGKKKRPRTKLEMIKIIRELDPKIGGKDIAKFGRKFLEKAEKDVMKKLRGKK